jgi:hypothetical protein
MVLGRIFKIKWTDGIARDEVFSKGEKNEDYFQKFKQNRCRPWIGHAVRHKEFVENILGGAIFGKVPWEDLDCSR